MTHLWRACVAFALCCIPAAAAADSPAPSRSMTLQEAVVPPNPVSPGPFGNTFKALPACDPETPDQARERMAAVALLQLFQLFAWADGYVRPSYFEPVVYESASPPDTGGGLAEAVVANGAADTGPTLQTVSATALGVGLTQKGLERLKQGAGNLHRAGDIRRLTQGENAAGERRKSQGARRSSQRKVMTREQRLYLSARRFFEGIQEGPEGSGVRQAYLHMLQHWDAEEVTEFRLTIVAEPDGRPDEQMAFEGTCGSSYYIFEARECVSTALCGCQDIRAFLDESVVWFPQDGDPRPNDYFLFREDLEEALDADLLQEEVEKARLRTTKQLAEQSARTAVSSQVATSEQASGGSLTFQPADDGGSGRGRAPSQCFTIEIEDTLIGLDPQSYEEPVCTQLFAEDHRLCAFNPYDTLQAQEGEPDAHVMSENSAAIPMRRCEPCALDTGDHGLIAPSSVWDNVMECVTYHPRVQDVSLDPCYDDVFSDACMDILDICDPL